MDNLAIYVYIPQYHEWLPISTVFGKQGTRNVSCTLRNAPHMQDLVVIASVIFNEVSVK